jgi:hypothetical protein
MTAASPPPLDPPSPLAPGTSPDAPEEVVLAPRFWVPLAVILLGDLCLLFIHVWDPARWLAVALALFGGFLLIQAGLLRLVFTAEALVVRRGGQEIRRFPYSDWLAWQVFFPPLPALFYFRERQSPHLLPVLFEAAALREQLERHVPLPAAVSPTP